MIRSGSSVCAVNSNQVQDFSLQTISHYWILQNAEDVEITRISIVVCFSWSN